MQPAPWQRPRVFVGAWFTYCAAYAPMLVLICSLRNAGFSGPQQLVASATISFLVLLIALGAAALLTNLPRPRFDTYSILSGLATSGVISLTTCAYAQPGGRLVAAALLMRLAVLPLGWMLDARRAGLKGLAATIAAICAISFPLVIHLPPIGRPSFSIGQLPARPFWYLLAGYFLCYLVKLFNLRSRRGNPSYLLAEQLTANSACAVGWLTAGMFITSLHPGLSLLSSPKAWLLGLLVQTSGIAGVIMFCADKYSWSVPLNRSAALVAAGLASYLGASATTPAEKTASGLLVAALALLRPGFKPGGPPSEQPPEVLSPAPTAPPPT